MEGTPLKKRLVDKDWKQRVYAYEDLAAIAQRKELNEAIKYVPFLKKMVGDTYPRAQEQAMTTLQVFAEIPLQMDPIQVGEICGVVIEKCLGGRSVTKDKATKILITLMEAGYSDVVLAQLLKGCSNKVPKIVAACLFTIREAMKAFGNAQIPVEKILPVLKTSFDHSLQEVRTEALALTTELHRWLGESFLPIIEDWELRPAQKKELELMFKNNIRTVKSNPATPDRRIRSSSLPASPIIANSSPVSIRKSQERIPTETPPRRSTDRSFTPRIADISSSPPSISPTSFDTSIDGDVSNFEIKDLSEDEDGETPLSGNGSPQENALDTHSEQHPVPSSSDRDDYGPTINILSTCTKGWYQEMSTGKWQDRKVRIDGLIAMCESTNTLRLQSGDYSKLIKELGEMLDYNKTVVVVSVVKLIGYLAKGLGREFLIYGKRLVPLLLDQLKGTNTMVLASLRECLDDIHNSSLTLSDFMNEISDALNHKVPQVRCETLLWVKASIKANKNTVADLKPFSKLLVKCLDDSKAAVRDTAYSILAILVVQRGDSYLQTLVDDFELDRIKVGKLKESVQSSSNELSDSGNLSSSPPSGGFGRPRSNSGKRGSLVNPTTPDLHGSLNHSQADSPYTPGGHAHLTHSSPSLHTPLKPSFQKDLFSQVTSSPQSNSPSHTPQPFSPGSHSAPSTPMARTHRAVESPNKPKVKKSDIPEKPTRTEPSNIGDSIGWLREVMTKGLGTLDELEHSLQTAHSKHSEDEKFTSELNAWNEQLLEEIEGYKAEIVALKQTIADLQGKGKNSLPAVLDLQNMTEEELDELERRQEEYLLQIRKIKIRMLH